MSNDVPAWVPTQRPELPPRSESQLYESASDWNRRYVLALLDEAAGPVPEEELATSIAANEHDKPAHLVTDDERKSVLARLRHVHLPKLADAGLIERNGDAVVSTGAGSAGGDPLDDEVEGGETLDRLYEALSDSLRRELLVALAERPEGVVSLEDAAAAVRGGSARADGGRDQVLVSLHHHHLPKLDEAGVVSYDAEERRIVYEGHPALREERL